MSAARLAFALLLAVAMNAGARGVSTAPTSPAAMEFVTSQLSLTSCERVVGVLPVAGGFRIAIDSELPGPRCDALGVIDITLGAFPPGTYRVSTAVTFPGTPPTSFEDGSTTFVVSPGVTSTTAGDDITQADLSGIWTTPNEPYTGFALIHSDGMGTMGRRGRVTGLWYDYSGTQPTWTLLLLDGSQFIFTGSVVQPVATGTGATRTITQPAVGTARLDVDGNGNVRLRGNVEQRAFDFPLERFRWPRAAWPAPANPN